MTPHPSTRSPSPGRRRARGSPSSCRSTPGAPQTGDPHRRSRSARSRPRARRGTTSSRRSARSGRRPRAGAIALHDLPAAASRATKRDMIRKMRDDQLQMGAFTTVGLETITPEMSALWIPLLFQNYDELDYVRGKLDARLEKALGDKGFVVLNWGDAGWVKYFAKKPIPRSRRCRTRSCSPGPATPESEEMYKDAGFKIVPAAADRHPDEPADRHDRGLSGARDRGAGEPVVRPGEEHDGHQVRAGRGRAPSSRRRRGTGSTRRSGRRCSTLARETGAKFTPQIRKLETDAIDAMVKRGLQIQKPTPQAEQEWQQTGREVLPEDPRQRSCRPTCSTKCGAWSRSIARRSPRRQPHPRRRPSPRHPSRRSRPRRRAREEVGGRSSR